MSSAKQATLDFGTFELDVHSTLLQLRHDMADDWYPDSLLYEDVLEPARLVSHVHDILAANVGLYKPDSKQTLDVPKKGLVLRYSLETTPFDRAIYQGLVSLLARYYDSLVPNNVFSSRLSLGRGKRKRYLFRQPIEQWAKFEGSVRAALAQKPVLLVTDLQDYYEHIRLPLLFQVLTELLSDVHADGPTKARLRHILITLKDCLSHWCYTAESGLPQNRDASAFLANLYLLPVDVHMTELGYSYFRYVDDVRIACADRYEARRALRDLIVKLRSQGLAVNAAKTAILHRQDANYRTYSGRPDRNLQAIDSMWNSRSLTLIRKSLPYLQRVALRLIETNGTQERAFRFCTRRYEKLALCDDLELDASFFEPIVSRVVRELIEQPFSSDQFVRLLKAAPVSRANLQSIEKLLLDRPVAIYEWQNYLLWQLLVYKQYRSERLITQARSLYVGATGPAERAAAALYLGANGNAQDRVFLLKDFRRSSDYMTQRNVLIAVQQVEFAQGFEDEVLPFVRSDVRGTYRRLRDGGTARYFAPLARIRHDQLWDELSLYD